MKKSTKTALGIVAAVLTAPIWLPVGILLLAAAVAAAAIIILALLAASIIVVPVYIVYKVFEKKPDSVPGDDEEAQGDAQQNHYY